MVDERLTQQEAPDAERRARGRTVPSGRDKSPIWGVSGAPNTKGKLYPCRRAPPLYISYASRFIACPKWQLPFLFASSALTSKTFAASVNDLTLGRRKICEPLFRQAERRRGECTCVAYPSQSPRWSQLA